jgi:hypothetical protein
MQISRSGPRGYPHGPPGTRLRIATVPSRHSCVVTLECGIPGGPSPSQAVSIHPMHPFSEPRDTEAQLDWRVSSLVAAAACAAIGLLECAKDTSWSRSRDRTPSPARASRPGAVVGPLDAAHAGGDRVGPAVPVRWRTLAKQRRRPFDARDRLVRRPHRGVRRRLLLGRRPDHVGTDSGTRDQLPHGEVPRDRCRHLRRRHRRLLRLRVLRAVPTYGPRGRAGGVARVAAAAQPRRSAHSRAAHGAQPTLPVQRLNAVAASFASESTTPPSTCSPGSATCCERRSTGRCRPR